MPSAMSRGLGLVLAVSMSLPALADPPEAQAIVEAADRARNPQTPFQMTMTLVDYVHGKAQDSVTLGIHAKIDPRTRQFRNLVRYLAPPRDEGKLVLLDASKMWFYDPASKTSVRISAQQRLTGQASNGDVLTVNLAHDYTAKLLGEETVKDADHQERKAWHLDLAAATSDATYNRLECWIERDTYRAIKARFYADSGRLLKVAYYRAFANVLGATRPTETVIIDAVDTSLVTTVRMGDFREQEIPDAWFQRDYLPRLEQK
jgi:Outer membrane lipoprotein-sorting protein